VGYIFKLIIGWTIGAFLAQIFSDFADPARRYMPFYLKLIDQYQSDVEVRSNAASASDAAKHPEASITPNRIDDEQASGAFFELQTMIQSMILRLMDYADKHGNTPNHIPDGWLYERGPRWVFSNNKFFFDLTRNMNGRNFIYRAAIEPFHRNGRLGFYCYLTVGTGFPEAEARFRQCFYVSDATMVKMRGEPDSEHQE
jgi:hypothetical protein